MWRELYYWKTGFFMNIISRIKRHFHYLWSVSSSDNYISFLREKGVEIGKDCYFQSPKTATVDTTRPLLVEIGDHCYFLEYFTLLTHDNVSKVFGPLKHDFLPSSGKVTIGNNVYFARHCSVLKGVTIGDNCIIGYGATITKSIPPGSVVVGTPAKVICTIDDYYEKRKKESLQEAVNYAQIIYHKKGRRPFVEEMWEEFPFWLNGDQEDKRLRFSVRYQTRGFYEYWKINHRALFSSFDDFIDYALNQTECEVKNK